MGAGAWGEFGPILAIALLLGSSRRFVALITLVVFAVVALVLALLPAEAHERAGARAPRRAATTPARRRPCAARCCCSSCCWRWRGPSASTPCSARSSPASSCAATPRRRRSQRLHGPGRGDRLRVLHPAVLHRVAAPTSTSTRSSRTPAPAALLRPACCSCAACRSTSSTGGRSPTRAARAVHPARRDRAAHPRRHHQPRGRGRRHAPGERRGPRRCRRAVGARVPAARRPARAPDAAAGGATDQERAENTV